MVLAITDLSIQAGSTNGGNLITVTGTGFTVSTQLYFDSVLGNSTTFVSATSMTTISPLVPNIGEVSIVARDAGLQSEPGIESKFFYFSPLTSPTFENKNIYFDSLANYVFFGDVVFAKNPLFASNGVSGPFNPSISYNFTAAQQFSAGVVIGGPLLVQATHILLEVNGILPIEIDVGGSSLQFEGILAVPGVGGGPAKVPPAGFEYLVKDTVTNTIYTYNGTT